MGVVFSMIPGFRFSDMMWHIQGSLTRTGSPRIVGIVVAQPHSELMTTEIMPALPYFHRRSGEAIDFFFAGFGQWPEAHNEVFPSDSEHLSEARKQAESWDFSANDLNDFRRELEARSKWRYSGGSDVLLLDARQDESADHRVALDWSSAMSINLERAKSQGAMLTVGMLFEQVFRYAEDHGNAARVSKFSDAQATVSAKSALWNALVAFLPEAVRNDATAVRNFVTEDFKRENG